MIRDVPTLIVGPSKSGKTFAGNVLLKAFGRETERVGNTSEVIITAILQDLLGGFPNEKLVPGFWDRVLDPNVDKREYLGRDVLFHVGNLLRHAYGSSYLTKKLLETHNIVTGGRHYTEVFEPLMEGVVQQLIILRRRSAHDNTYKISQSMEDYLQKTYGEKVVIVENNYSLEDFRRTLNDLTGEPRC